MQTQSKTYQLESPKVLAQHTVYSILLTISVAHMLNDMMQSVIPAIYPIIKEKYNFTFTQIGMINLVFQLTASVLQPVVGIYTDKHPKPFSLSIGMSSTLVGLVSLAFASNYWMILLSVAFIGLGSSVFHPESSRVAQFASGGRKGLAQSIFQVGGNFGTSLGPLLTALVVVSYGQISILWFALVALFTIAILYLVGKWYKIQLDFLKARNGKSNTDRVATHHFSKNKIYFALGILLILMFSKYFYMSSMINYFSFYTIEKFGLSIKTSQIYLFAFLFAVAAGTLIGGPIGDKYGRKYVIWFSILGTAPFSLILPHVGLSMTIIMAVLAGFILSSAFSAILVYATDLLPGKVGVIAGLFFGLAFGMGGLASAFWGWLADITDIQYVFHITAYLPLLGIVTVFLPNIEVKNKRQ